MDVYWSIERCGWVPCRGPRDSLGTPWWRVEREPEREPEPGPAPDVPLQRADEQQVAVEH